MRKEGQALLASLRILIVDDSSIVRNAIRDLLRDCEEGFGVYESEDGHSAMQQVHEVKPDVILLDLGAPAASGFELAEQLREGDPSRTVIIMSQQDPGVLRKLTEHFGQQLCLAKSALASELLPMLREIAANRSAHS
jgi:DNA-binding NarL/FixJ family response regulator